MYNNNYRHRLHRNLVISSVSAMTLVTGALTLNNGFNEGKYTPIILDKTKAYKVIEKKYNSDNYKEKEIFLKQNEMDVNKIISIKDKDSNNVISYDVSKFSDDLINEIINSINKKESYNLIKSYVENNSKIIDYTVNNEEYIPSCDNYNLMLTTYDKLSDKLYDVDANKSDNRQAIVYYSLSMILAGCIGGFGGLIITNDKDNKDKKKIK